MEKTRRYNIEGAILNIPLRYDKLSRMEIEEYPDFLEHPIYTPAGYPLMLTCEDACSHAETVGGELCIDCGSCRFYRQAPNTLIGVCGHEKMRRSS